MNFGMVGLILAVVCAIIALFKVDWPEGWKMRYILPCVATGAVFILWAMDKVGG